MIVSLLMGLVADLVVRFCRLDAPILRSRDRSLLPGSRRPLDPAQAHAHPLAHLLAPRRRSGGRTRLDGALHRHRCFPCRAGTGPAPCARRPGQAAARDPPGRSSLERRRRVRGRASARDRQPARVLRSVAHRCPGLDGRQCGVTRRASTSAPTAIGPRSKAWHQLPASTVMTRLSTPGARGLSAQEAETRLAQVGANRLPAPEPKSSLEILSGHLTSLPVLLLGGAAALSLVSAAPIEAAVILAVVAANATVGYITERRVERVLTSLRSTTTPRALVRRDGVETTLPAAAVVPGDVLVLKAGHDVPADARLIEVDGLSVDESALTGESVPVAKVVTVPAGLNGALGDRVNMVHAGTVIAGGLRPGGHHRHRSPHRDRTDPGARRGYRLAADAARAAARPHRAAAGRSVARRLRGRPRPRCLARCASARDGAQRDLAGGRRRAGRPAGGGDDDAGAGHPADAATRDPGASPGGGREPRRCDGHLRGQDGHAHREPHDRGLLVHRPARVRARPGARRGAGERRRPGPGAPASPCSATRPSSATRASPAGGSSTESALARRGARRRSRLSRAPSASSRPASPPAHRGRHLDGHGARHRRRRSRPGQGARRRSCSRGPIVASTTASSDH